MQLALGHLGWTPEVFWSASLDEFQCALEGYEERQKRDDFRIGNLMALYANSKRDDQKRPEPYAPWDFFSSLKAPDENDAGEEESPDSLELTPEVFAMLNRDPNAPPPTKTEATEPE